MRVTIWSLLAALSAGVVACQQPAPQPSKDAPVAGETKPAAVAAPAEVAAAEGEVMDDCPGESEDHAACGEIERASADEGHFGQPFALQQREALSAAATRLAEAGEGEKVQVTGTVDSVCKKKGCWMVIKDGDVTARVFTHAGKFFMPVGTNKGRQAVVEGELTAKTMSEKFAKHLAEDKGEDPSKVTGPVKEWVINATGAQLL